MSMLLLAICLAAGFAVGKFVQLPAVMRRVVGWGLSFCLFALVFVLGLKLGSDHGLLSQLGSIGVSALTLAVGCTAGSILAVKAYLLVRNLVRGQKS
jgi:hypothetical protein